MKYLTPYQAEVVHAWWHGLQPDGAPGEVPTDSDSREQMRPFRFDRGHRARLRRAASLLELEGESACFELRARLGQMRRPWVEAHDAEWLFLVAGAVAQVDDTYQDRSLALALGKGSAGIDSSPPLSRMRFRRLLKEEGPEAFYLQLRRALRLVEGKLNVAQLADDLIGWCAERGLAERPAEAVRYRWARDYFLDRKEQKAAAQMNSAPNNSKGSQETTS